MAVHPGRTRILLEGLLAAALLAALVAGVVSLLAWGTVQGLVWLLD